MIWPGTDSGVIKHNSTSEPFHIIESWMIEYVSFEKEKKILFVLDVGSEILIGLEI